MEGTKCIYCGTSENLSVSDIIPDALTNARITNKNVCRVEHNNKFSDLFESKVISELGFIANTLDVKSSKGQDFATYSAQVTIGDQKYDISMRSEKNIFDGRVIKTPDKVYGLTSYEKALAIAKDPDKVTPIDVNNIVLETTVNISLGIFLMKQCIG